MDKDQLLKQGIDALRAGRKSEGRRFLEKVLEIDDRNETAWLWMSGAVDTDEERHICLENVLAINPNNAVAKKGLDRLITASGSGKIHVMPLSAQNPPDAEKTGGRPEPIESSRTAASFVVGSDLSKVEPEMAGTSNRQTPKNSTSIKAKSKLSRIQIGVIFGLGVSLCVLMSVAVVLIWQWLNTGSLPVIATERVAQYPPVLGLSSPVAVVPKVTQIQATQGILLSPTGVSALAVDVPSSTDPRYFVLTVSDMPAGFQIVLENTGYWSNQSVAQSRENPVDFLSKLQTWGRMNGYSAQYKQSGSRPIFIDSSAIIMNTQEGAHAYFDYLRTEQMQQGWSQVSSPVIGEESSSYTIQKKDAQNSFLQWIFYETHFRVRNVIAILSQSGLSGSVEFTDILPYARKIATRINNQPDETSLASLPNTTPIPGPTSTSTEAPTPTTSPTPTQIVQILEQTQTLGPIWNSTRDESFSVTIVLHTVKFSFGSDLFKPKSGNVYTSVDLTIKNLGPDPIRSIGSTDFQIRDANGALRDTDYVYEFRDCSLDFVDLSPNGNISGCVTFEVPITGKLELIYAPYKYEGLKPGRYMTFIIR
jgi:hypothetical protein